MPKFLKNKPSIKIFVSENTFKKKISNSIKLNRAKKTLIKKHLKRVI